MRIYGNFNLGLFDINKFAISVYWRNYTDIIGGIWASLILEKKNFMWTATNINFEWKHC